MKRLFVGLCLILSLCFAPVAIAATNFYGATALTGGASGDLDSIDGTNLATGDGAYVITATDYYVYYLNATSGAAESSPDVISPDANAGNKRWILLFQGDAATAEIAQLAVTDGNIIVGNGTTWVAESGATARTSLGLGSGDAVTHTAITGNGVLTVKPDATNEVFQVNDGTIDFTDGNAGTTGTLTVDASGNWSYNKNIVSTGNVAGATYGSDASISNAELLTLDDGATTEILVGGGAGSAPVWTTATGTLAPVRADSPILSTQYTMNSLVTKQSSQSVNDEAEITLATGVSGWGFAQAGDNEQWIQFSFTTAGVVTVIANSALAVNTDTDGNLCVYDAGAGIAIKNRLGGAKIIRYVVNYS